MANLIGAAYKWRIDNNVYSYITNTEGGEPFIVSGSTECNEELIRNKVQNFTKDQYETRFQEMVSAVHAYNNGKYSYVQFLDYTIYMNEAEQCDIYNRPDVVTDVDFTVCATTLPSGSEATVGIYTTDEDIECREGEKIRKYHIDFGIPKGSRFIPIIVTDEELLQNGEQIIRENDILDGDFVVSVDSNTIWSCGRDYQFINSGIQLNATAYRYFSNINAYSFGENDIAQGVNSITEGYASVAGYEGFSNQIEDIGEDIAGYYSHAEGNATAAVGSASHSEGKKTYASGVASHAEGYNTEAKGANSHSEGLGTLAEGISAHAEGYNTQAIANGSHAEGSGSIGNGLFSHVEGGYNTTHGECSHAEGSINIAYGNYSHVEGKGNVAKNTGQHVSGIYAEIDETNNAIFQVGIGTNDSRRKDAFRINKDGSFVFAVPENDETPIFTFLSDVEQQEASAINEDEGEPVQTYNMRRSAARQTNIPVTASNFIDLVNLQQNIDDAINEIEFPVNQKDLNDLQEKIEDVLDDLEELEEKLSGDLEDLKEELSKDFVDMINEQENNYNNSIYEVLSRTADLESQLDGEATAWFLKGEPTLINEPAIDWNENGTDGKESYASHEGDTYTDITENEDGSIGRSWRWSSIINESGETIGWGWHEISDSRIIRALYEASRAQSTADGKSTVYISKNENGNKVPDHYQVGDMWIINKIALQNGGFFEEDNKYYTKENGQKGTLISIGELLTANANSEEYNVGHWSKEIKYTDDTYAIEAKERADKAYDYAESGHTEALKAIELLNGISSDGRVYPNEFKELELKKQTIYSEMIELVGESGNTGEASLWETGVDTADDYFNAANSAISTLEYYTDEDNFEVDTKTQQSLGYIQILNSDENKTHVGYWGNITNYYIKRQELLNDIADASKEYADNIKGAAEAVSSAATIAYWAAYDAAQSASAALGVLNDVGEDNVVAITEFAALESELEIIERDLIEIGNSVDLYRDSDFYGELTGSTAHYNDNTVTYSGFTAYKEAQIKAVDALKYHCGKTATKGDDNITAGQREGDKNEHGSIIIRTTKNNNALTTPFEIDYKNIGDYYNVRQSMLEHIAFVAKLYAESLQTKLSPENVAAILGQIKIDGVNLVTGSRCNFAMGQWGSTDDLTITKNVEDDHTETTINVDSKLSFCTCLYNGKDIDVITNKQWEKEYISASIDVCIPKDNVTEEDEQNPKKVNFGIVLGCYDNGELINLFSEYTTDIECVYDKWTRLKLTFYMENDVTDVFTKNEKEYLVSHVYLVVYDADSKSNFDKGTTFKFRKIQIEFNTSCSSWYPSPEDIDEIYSIAVDAQQNANSAKEAAEASMRLLTDMSSDNKLTYAEKLAIKKEWSEIQEEYEQADSDVQRAWIEHGFLSPQEYEDYKEIYNSLNEYLNPTGTSAIEFNIGDKSYTINGRCYINSGETTDISGHTIHTKSSSGEQTLTGTTCFNKVFSTYYAKHVGFMNCLAEQLAYLEVRSVKIGGVNLLKNSSFTNLTDGSNYDNKTYWIYNQSSYTGSGSYSLSVENGCLKLTSTVPSWNKYSPRMGFTQTKYNIKGQSYVLSFDAYADKEVVIKAETGHGSWGDDKKATITTERKRHSILITGENGGSDYYNIFFLRIDDNVQTSIYFDNFKLEEGDIATAWTMAPEDQMAYIDNINNYVKELEESLQNQIDGVVNSYFMEGAPCDTDGTVRTTIEPFSEWMSSYTVSNNIYTLTPGKINHLMDHLGDTYTNIEEAILLDSSMWEEGGIVWSTKASESGADQASDYFVRTKYINVEGCSELLRLPSNYYYTIFYYSSNKERCLLVNSVTAEGSATTTYLQILKKVSNEDVAYFRLRLGYVDGYENKLEFNIGDAVDAKAMINPRAGLSWRWCDITTTTSHETTAKYITVKYTSNSGDEISKNLHWHKIADSDAVRALQAAAAAQDAADGKRRVFTGEPYTPYDEGDLWVKTDKNNPALTDTLYCKISRATGEWDDEDWASSTVAQDALNGLNNLTVGGRNLLRNTRSLSFEASSGDEYSFTHFTPTVPLKPSTEYVFSVDSTTVSPNTVTGFTFYIYGYNGEKYTTGHKSIAIPISNERKFVKFTTPETVESTDVALIYCGISGKTAGNSITLKKFKLEEGHVPTEWSPAPEDADYLYDVMNSGATESKGGLFLTNVLALRDMNNETVTGGMSGLHYDNVLLWGGGTYEEAASAAIGTDYLKGNDTEKITTLIKKDGTGKIGAFYIDEDTVKVVSDTQTTIITNKTINETAPLQTTITGNTGSCSPTVTSSHFSRTNEFGNANGYYEIISCEVDGLTVNGGYTINVSVSDIDLNVSCSEVLDGEEKFNNSYCIAEGKLCGFKVIVTDGTSTTTVLAEKPFSSGGNYSKNLYVDPNYQIRHEISGTFNETASSGDVSFKTKTNKIIVKLQSFVYGKTDLSDFSDAYDDVVTNASPKVYFTCTCNHTIKGTDKYTVIAKDGIAISSNSDAQFYIDNSSSNLKIRMNGLPQSPTNLQKGDLYTSGGVLMVKM